MIDPAKLYARDERLSQRLFGHTGAWVGRPRFPKPRTRAERYALSKIPPQSVTLHVYRVAELLERAFLDGVEAGKR